MVNHCADGIWFEEVCTNGETCTQRSVHPQRPTLSLRLETNKETGSCSGRHWIALVLRQLDDSPGQERRKYGCLRH